MLTDLGDAARTSGLPVVEEPGWRGRGHGAMVAVDSIICHHTAGPATGDAPSLPAVRDGRADLAGPLSHLVLARSGTVHVVAAGLCWHAGLTFQPWQSNAHAIGVEAEATGRDPWPAVQYDAYVRLCRALADHYDVPYARVLGHKEVASPAGRKPDPNFSMPDFRAALAAGGGAAPAPSGPYCAYGERSDHVLTLQKFMTSHFPSYNRYRPTGFYGEATRDGVREFQKRTGITGPDADGFIVGPRTLAKLQSFGFAP